METSIEFVLILYVKWRLFLIILDPQRKESQVVSDNLDTNVLSALRGQWSVVFIYMVWMNKKTKKESFCLYVSSFTCVETSLYHSTWSRVSKNRFKILFEKQSEMHYKITWSVAQ